MGLTANCRADYIKTIRAWPSVEEAWVASRDQPAKGALTGKRRGDDASTGYVRVKQETR